MADPPQPPPVRRFRTRAGVIRKPAEERAAFLRAEALRQENQAQLQPSQAQQDVGRRTSRVQQRDPRVRSQNTESVFSSTGGVTSSKPKGNHAVSGTEELIERAEGGGIESIESEGSGRPKAVRGAAEKPVSAIKKTAGKQTKPKSKKDDVIYKSDEGPHADEGEAVDIEDIDRITISSDEDRGEDDDDVIFSHRRLIERPPKLQLGLRPVRAARDLLARDVQNEAYKKARRTKGKGKDKEPPIDDLDQAYQMDLDEGDEDDEHEMSILPQETAPILEDKARVTSPSPIKRRRKSSMKESRKLEIETIEERAERTRQSSELQKMRNELFPRTLDQPCKEKESHRAAANHFSNGQPYLFQFPPLTPMLITPSQRPDIKMEPPSTAIPPTETRIKKEKEKQKADDADTKARLITNTTITTSEAPRLLTAATSPALPAGLAGRLHVHRSGRVTLEWGTTDSSLSGTDVGASNGADPTNLEVKWGSEVDFLQDVVLLSGVQGGNEEAAAGGGIKVEAGRKAWALRQVRKKFVVVPDWGRVYE